MAVSIATQVSHVPRSRDGRGATPVPPAAAAPKAGSPTPPARAPAWQGPAVGETLEGPRTSPPKPPARNPLQNLARQL